MRPVAADHTDGHWPVAHWLLYRIQSSLLADNTPLLNCAYVAPLPSNRIRLIGILQVRRQHRVLHQK
ncbi:hypothetical protein TcWFU_008336 [Taenia crassiceps]|uniref:Uncharacterized protein n=1 Tax=Taenia crassiceps TaxID=6207 RepID=A0ABR4QE64_9CEST